MRIRRLVAAVMAAALPASLLAAAPALAQPQPDRVEVVVEGLANPRGIATGPDGMLYVAEAGSGGDECVEREFDGETFTECFGMTGKVTRVNPQSGNATTLAEFPSLADEDGSFAGGVADVSVAPDGTVYAVVMGLHDPETRQGYVEEFGEELAITGHLVRIEEGGEIVSVADLMEWEAENDPDRHDPNEATEGVDSNPYGLLAVDGGVFVADAGGNTLLHVNEEGEIALFAVFPSQMAPAPEFMGMPPGSEIPAQAVPTSVAMDADGDLYVGELTGFPFPVGLARVWSFDDGEAQVFDTGFTNVTGITFRDDDLFAVEMIHKGLLSVEAGEGEPDMSGALVRRRPDGTKQVLLNDTLVVPADATTVDDLIYITNMSVFPGAGQVLAFDPSQTHDAAIQAACDPDAVDWPQFDDIYGISHDEAIACLAWWGIARGVDAETFAPTGSMTRAQMASFLARLVAAAGGELSDEPDDHFDDDEGSTHEMAINQLADAGVLEGRGDRTFEPRATTTRGQMAAMLVRTYEYVTGESLPEGEDRFNDDDGTTHEDAINAAANAGWVTGVDEDTFQPNATVTRQQAASMTARSLATYVEEGHATQPS